MSNVHHDGKFKFCIAEEDVSVERGLSVDDDGERIALVCVATPEEMENALPVLGRGAREREKASEQLLWHADLRMIRTKLDAAAKIDPPPAGLGPRKTTPCRVSATDNHLSREVAIKELPEAFAQDAEWLARFEREARTLASLNHPNIAIIHGLEKSPAEAGHYGDVRALVMELVEGPTLADRIAQGAMLNWFEELKRLLPAK
jgi:hypothetical protein